MENRITAKTAKTRKQNDRTGWIMAIYLMGLFIGALSTGSITPVRTIIQNSFGVDDQAGIWMITIFTLCYAAIIPISGKLADRLGRKVVFIVSIALFGAGSVISGVATESFALFLVGRAVQAIGGGGIMPIATAEFGTSFPEEKRGMALGMVGAVYGMGNVFGATFGSAILDLFGVDGWTWIFLINVPICALIIIGGIAFIPNNRAEEVYRIDKLGTLLMTATILSLLYGLKNIDFFDFLPSLTHRDVWPFLLIAAVLIPIFVFVEKRAEDPIFHIEYMKNSQIVVTLGMGLLAGCSLMGMIFIPQFAENCLKMPSGDGGYFVIILGLMAGAVSPISGKLIDKFGSRPVLGAGFVFSILGALYIAFITAVHMNLTNVIICLILVGLGLGLIMGTPLNYMMLRHTKEEDSNSALATLSLIRSIGTAIAPAIMVGFIAQAGATMQTEIMKEMPDIPEVPEMEQQIQLRSIVDQLKDDEDFQKRMGNIDLDAMLNMDMDMDIDMTSSGGDMKLPADLLDELQNSDVTTITRASKHMARYMFDRFTPDVISDIQDGINEGIHGIGEGITGVNTGISEISDGISGISSGQAGIRKGISGISQGIDGMAQGIARIKSQIADAKADAAQMEQQKSQLQQYEQMAQAAVNKAQEAYDSIKPEDYETEEEYNAAKAEAKEALDTAETALTKARSAIAGIQQGIDGINKGIAGMTQGLEKLTAKQEKAKKSRASMKAAIGEMESAKKEMYDAINQMKSKQQLMIDARDLMISMRDDIPELFENVEEEYISEIDKSSEDIEAAYQKTLNKGFRNMFICVAIFNIIGLLLLMIYRDDRRKEDL